MAGYAGLEADLEILRGIISNYSASHLHQAAWEILGEKLPSATSEPDLVEEILELYLDLNRFRPHRVDIQAWRDLTYDK